MLISCPKCNSKYDIKGSLIGINEEHKAKCYRCETIFSIKRRNPEHLEKIVHSLKKEISDWESKNSVYEEDEPQEDKNKGDLLDEFISDVESDKAEKELNTFSAEIGDIDDLSEENGNNTFTYDEELEINSLLNEIEAREIAEPIEKEKSLEDIEGLFSDKSSSEFSNSTAGSTELDNLLSEFHEISGEEMSDSRMDIEDLNVEQADSLVSTSEDENSFPDQSDEFGDISSQEVKVEENNILSSPHDAQKIPDEEDDIERLLSEVSRETSEIPESLSGQYDIDELIAEAQDETKSSPGKTEEVTDLSGKSNPLGGQDDDIDRLMAEARGENVEPSDSLSGGQDDIDKILASARGETELSTVKTEEVTDLSGESDTLGGQDDIDRLIAEARGEKVEPSDSLSDGQDDIDKILASARDETKQSTGKTEEVTDLSGESDTLGGQDDIDRLMAEARGENVEPSDSLSGQDDIDKILSAASSGGGSADMEPDTSKSGNSILSAADLESLLSGEGGEDTGFMKTGDQPSEFQNSTDKTITTATDQTSNSTSSNKSQILSEEDLEKLLSGAAGEDSGFMKEDSGSTVRAQEESDSRTKLEVGEEEEPKTEVSDSDLDTLISTVESNEEDFTTKNQEEIAEENDSEEEDVKVKKKRFNFIFSFMKKFKRKSGKESDELEELLEENRSEESDVSTKTKKKIGKKILVSVGIVLFITAGGLSAYFFTMNRIGKHTSKESASINKEEKTELAENHVVPAPENSSHATTPDIKEAETDLPINNDNVEKQKPSLQPMDRGSSQVNIGIILPVYRNLDEFKVLDIVLKIDFMSADVASKVRNNLPYYETKIEESIDSYFSDKLYDDIPFVKEQLQKSLLVDVNNFITFGKAKNVTVEFLKLKENEEKSAENEKKH